MRAFGFAVCWTTIVVVWAAGILAELTNLERAVVTAVAVVSLLVSWVAWEPWRT